MQWSGADLEAHHAYLFVGEQNVLVEEIKKHIENAVDSPLLGNSSVSIEEFEVFTIESARALAERQLRKGAGHFLIAFGSITREAQNALLKVFEEPTTGTYFYIVVSQKDLLLPTILSRMFVIEESANTNDEIVGEEVRAFIEGSAAKRLEIVAPLIEEKNKAAIQAFLQGLEHELSQDSAENKKALAAVLHTKKYINDRGASLNLLLENLAVTII